jgi:hypothetical protein
MHTNGSRDPRVQRLSDARDAALARARESTAAYEQARASSDQREADRHLSEGKLASAEERRLAGELKRIRRLPIG